MELAGTGRSVRCVAVDVVRTPVDADLATRLLLLADGVERWLDAYRPEVVAVERVFSQYNVRTAMGTAQAGGVVALLNTNCPTGNVEASKRRMNGGWEPCGNPACARLVYAVTSAAACAILVPS